MFERVVVKLSSIVVGLAVLHGQPEEVPKTQPSAVIRRDGLLDDEVEVRRQPSEQVRYGTGQRGALQGLVPQNLCVLVQAMQELGIEPVFRA